MFKYLFLLLAVFSLSAEEKFIQVSGAELYCKTMGSGAPVIVLHGGAGYLTHEYLLPHLAPLADNHFVVFYDQRGQGQSTGMIDPEHINLKTYVEDLDAVRTSFGLKKVTLLGHSWGGFLALHYAFAHPEAVDKLILVDSMPVTSEDLMLFFPELGKRLEPYQKELKAIESSPAYLAGEPTAEATQLKMVFQTYMYNPQNIHKVNFLMTQQAILNGRKVWQILKEQIFMKPYDLSSQLAKLQIPTLIIHGDTDPIPYVTAEHAQALIPASKLVKIDQSGHFPFVEQPEVFFKSVGK